MCLQGFPGGGWCGPDGYTDRQQRASFGILGLLPSTSPFDIIDDGPTSVNFRAGKHRGSLLWIGNVYILYRRQALLSCSFCQGD